MMEDPKRAEKLAARLGASLAALKARRDAEDLRDRMRAPFIYADLSAGGLLPLPRKAAK